MCIPSIYFLVLKHFLFLHLRTGAKGQNKFFTDSNGREFMERVYNYRPTWDLEVPYAYGILA